MLIRTGRMKLYNDPAAYMAKPPGMGLDAARYLVEEGGADPGRRQPQLRDLPVRGGRRLRAAAHYLLAQRGVPIIELAALDELSRDQVYEFAFIGGPLKIRGGDAAPLRPVAMPLR